MNITWTNGNDYAMPYLNSLGNEFFIGVTWRISMIIWMHLLFMQAIGYEEQ